jgi:ubiquinone/menaquinone biosynthesis C-methylase UbiE
MAGNAMFNNAAAYDRFMGQWSTRLAPLFAGFALAPGNSRVLDVGCGTGSMIQATKDRNPAAVIVGIDPSAEFVAYSRSRFADKSITIDQGSAFDLPYPDDTFDSSVSCLVFHLIPEPGKAALEMRRVTRPGGVVAACTWNLSAVERTAILWEEQIKLDPAAEKERETARFCSRDGELTGVWKEAGLENIEETDFRMTMSFDSFDEYWSPILDGVGPTGAYVARLPGPAQLALRDALRKRLLGNKRDGPIRLGARALAVKGTVRAAEARPTSLTPIG